MITTKQRAFLRSLANGIDMGAVEAIGAANDLARQVYNSIQSALEKDHFGILTAKFDRCTNRVIYIL